jgi:NADH dehydrogenase [ubiquinone] 1 alpha subcomplex assembly factor 7
VSPLHGLLRRLIRAEGPIGVDRYMALALGHPLYGYYTRKDPLGTGGDFTTAPEISQVFGELIGLALADAWLRAGAPDPVLLVELGPGRGTLMADLLRATARVPGFRRALRLHLVETGRALRARQEELLAGAGASWHERLEEVPEGALLLVANEMLDALPVRQLERGADGWHERRIGLDGDRLVLVRDAAPSPLALALPESFQATRPGMVAELSPAREAVAREIGRRVAAAGILALIVDYGAAFPGPGGDTLQAVRGHAPWPVLEAPGEADLTSHVDFGAVARAAAAAGASAHGPVPQGRFLRALGIEERLARLVRGASPEAAGRLRQGAERLVDPAQMGLSFKVMALTRPGAPPPAGLAVGDGP